MVLFSLKNTFQNKIKLSRPFWVLFWDINLVEFMSQKSTTKIGRNYEKVQNISRFTRTFFRSKVQEKSYWILFCFEQDIFFNTGKVLLNFFLNSYKSWVIFGTKVPENCHLILVCLVPEFCREKSNGKVSFNFFIENFNNPK